MSGQSNLPEGALSPKQTPLTKAVTISEEPETIEPELHRVDSPPVTRKHRASMSGRRMTGRPAANLSSTSIHSVSSQISQLSLDAPQDEPPKPHEHDSFIHQVTSWLHEERAKQKARRSRHKPSSQQYLDAQRSPGLRPRSDSQTSEAALALDKLERILSGYATAGKEGLASIGIGHMKHAPNLRRGSSMSKKLKRGSIAASSDTEWHDGDILVPNVEAVLDNSKTMAYSGGGVDDGNSASKDKQHWITFKQDIIRLTHTLRLKGWRRIPVEEGGQIDVERLSGALTNAVYVVSPPKDLPQTDRTDDNAPTISRKPPKKLLLRVYGPQAEHLIDRDSELLILRRLARKRIGPRLLGTFNNGRFEEFFHARTLTAQDLRDPNTSRHIAKRMRELHDGIELLEEERDGGPFVFKNWDSWVNRCEQVISWLDKQILSSKTAPYAKQESWRRRGLVLGVEWSVFRKAVEEARKYLYTISGGSRGVRDKLVFAHNDTQYGNLLRLTPSGESPLLLPANSHKQLVVIDFEYASANPPAIEFANHFTEWCYNYHHQAHPHKCTTRAYPTPDEQHRFIKAYVEHRPQFNINSTTGTPKLAPSPSLGPTSSISTFMLDSRAPPGGYPFPSNYEVEERAREDATEKEIQKIMHETRLWRVANTAQWVAWGIVQAKLPEEFEHDSKTNIEEGDNGVAMTDPLDPEVKQIVEDAKNDRPESRRHETEHHQGDAAENSESEIKNVAVSALLRVGSREGSKAAESPEVGPTEQQEGEPEEFDYLAYAQDRALFFWGDILQLGILKETDLPEDLLKRAKRVEY